ncbi:MAG: polyprenyl synthetase family protein [Bacteroidaceae bacterium]|nr:polyprenyl synthetase family protein [Bacteroidaceae bacterium]
MDKLTEIRRPIEAELKAYRELFEGTLTTENPLLRVALNHLLQRQGKMMRPILVLLAARSVGRVNEAVLHAAVSLELLHTASLVHDDVVDESDRRRGQKSVNALLDNKVAVLVGDFLLSKALYHAAQTGSGRVVTWVSELGQTLSDGELLQLANIDKTSISEEDYFEVIRKKTASLFETCAKCGAMLAGAGEGDIRRLREFGECVGMCFQMRDDLLDYDNQHDTGKPSGNDMREGKLTLPVIHALLEAGNSEMTEVALKVRRAEATGEEIDALVRFTIDEGGLVYTMKNIDKMAYNSIAMIPSLESDSPVADALRKYVAFVVGRDV